MRLAALDIGSNSVKLLVADRTSAGLREVMARVEMTRLSEGLSRHRCLSLEAMDRTLRAAAEFRLLAEGKGAQRILAAGTEALRRAENSRDFLLRCEYEVGLRVRVLPGEEEARLSYLGGTSGLKSGPTVAVDIGGASTELMTGRDGRITRQRSLPIGVVVLTEHFLKSDPPTPKELQAMEDLVREWLESAPRMTAAKEFVAIGGTSTSLISMLLRMGGVSARRVHGRRFTVESARRACRRLSAMPLERRKRVPGLPPSRADVILAGLAILIAAAERYSVSSIRASARGLRHGLLLDASPPIMSRP